jgi:transcriptional regulator with XRE-family HTH domain
LKQDYNFTLGELVYTVRKINKLTQVQYSKQLGVVQSTISKVEKDIFDDVPFSLISKISNDFKIPLQHFQIGHLPIRKSTNLTKTIPKEYITDGIFKAKTIYYILKSLEVSYGPQIYKELKLPYQLLSLSNITYSFDFINKLYSITKDKLPQTIDHIQLTGNSEISLENIKKYMADFYGISLVGKAIEIPTGLSFTIKFNSELHELDHIYLTILKLELKLLFNTGMVFTSKKVGEFFEINCELV